MATEEQIKGIISTLESLEQDSEVPKSTFPSKALIFDIIPSFPSPFLGGISSTDIVNFLFFNISVIFIFYQLID